MLLDECLAAAGRRGRGRARHGAVVALGRRAPRPPSCAATATACSASSRAAPTRPCAPRSAEGLVAIGFDGYAIGGLAVGEPQELMFARSRRPARCCPTDRPRYLMGVGKPADLVGAVLRGVDMFDCVLPTRSGRTGQAFTRRGTVNLTNARHADDPRPLDETSDCPAARDYCRAYLHHLVRSGEILGAMLLTWNNLWYYQDLMRALRGAIIDGRLADWATAHTEQQARGDISIWSA